MGPKQQLSVISGSCSSKFSNKILSLLLSPVSHLIQFVVLSGLVLLVTIIVKAFSQVQGQGADSFGRETGGDKY